MVYPLNLVPGTQDDYHIELLGFFKPELGDHVLMFPDGKKIWYEAQNREQTFLDLNSANPDDGKSSNIFHETTKAWVEVIDEGLHWLKRIFPEAA